MNEEPKKKLFTRRRFLWAGGSVVAASDLGVGGYWIYDLRQRFGRGATAEIPDHRVELPEFLSLAEEMGLGTVDFRSLQPLEITGA